VTLLTPYSIQIRHKSVMLSDAREEDVSWREEGSVTYDKEGAIRPLQQSTRLWNSQRAISLLKMEVGLVIETSRAVIALF